MQSLFEGQSRVCPVGHVAVRFLRNPIPPVGRHLTADQLPDNCIVVMRGQFKQFYGMFSDHPANTAHVNINECNRAQLKTLQLKVAAGSTARAVDLIWNAVQQAKFVSEVEFKNFLDANGIKIAADDLCDCVWSEE